MRCPNCGADNISQNCVYCGSFIPVSAFNYAGFWVRLGAYIIDAIIILLIIYLPVSIIANILFPPVYPYYSSSTQNSSAFYSSYLSYILLTIAYFAGFESSKGMATPGKSAMGLIVIDKNGNRINFGKGITRLLGKIVSALILGFGFFMIGFDSQKRGFHDYIAGTYVIKKGFYTSPAQPSSSQGFGPQASPQQYVANASQGYAQPSPGYFNNNPAVVQPEIAQHVVASASLYVNGIAIPLIPGALIKESSIPGSKSQSGSGIIAEVLNSPGDPNVMGLKNLSQNNWTIFNNNKATALEPGRTVKIAEGTRIKFGMLIGEIRKY